MDRTAHFEDLLQRAGFRGGEGEDIGRVIDGATVYAALRYGSQRHVERIVWWVELEESPNAEDALDSVVALTVRHRTMLDALGLAMGLNRAPTTGHDELDAMSYVESTAPGGEVRRCLGSPELQQAIVDLFRRGLTVRLRGGRLTATQSSLLDTLRMEDVLENAQRVVVAARHLPRFRHVDRLDEGGPDAFQRAGLALILVALTGALATASGSEQIIVEAATTPAVMAVVVLGLVTLLVLVWRLSAGTSVGLRRFALVSIPGTVAWVSWVMAVAIWS